MRVPAAIALTALAALRLSAAAVSDIDGNPHHVPGEAGATATIIYFVTHDCPISNRYMPEIDRICSEHSSRSVRCLMAYVDPTVSVQEIRDHQIEYRSTQTAIHDSGHELVELAGATVTPEAALFDRAGRLVYRGRIDNLYAALGTPRRRPSERDLRDALEQTLAGKPVSRPRTQAVGCFIPYLKATKTGDSL